MRELRALFEWCVARRWMDASSMNPERFAAAIALYIHHFSLLREHRPRTVHAPLILWWASTASDRLWRTATRAGTKEMVVGGTHFSIMQPPFIETIADTVNRES